MSNNYAREGNKEIEKRFIEIARSRIKEDLQDNFILEHLEEVGEIDLHFISYNENELGILIEVLEEEYSIYACIEGGALCLY